MEKLFSNHRRFIGYLFILIIGALVASIFWYPKIQDKKSLIEYRDFEINNLKDQISALRSDYENTTRPRPSKIISFIQNEKLNEENLYKINCLKDVENNNDPLLQIIKNNLANDEVIGAICYNNELQQAAVLVNKLMWPQSVYAANEYTVSLNLYDINSKQKIALSEQKFSLYEACNEITHWIKSSYSTQSGYYIKCASSDNLINSVYRLKDSDSRMDVETVKKCKTVNIYTSRGEIKSTKTECSTYDDYQQCVNKGLL